MDWELTLLNYIHTRVVQEKDGELAITNQALLFRTKSVNGRQTQMVSIFIPVNSLYTCETADPKCKGNNLRLHMICCRMSIFRQKFSPCWNENSDVIKPCTKRLNQRCACKLFNNWPFATGWEETWVISAIASFQGVSTASILEVTSTISLKSLETSLWVSSNPAIKEPRMRHETTREVFWGI